MPESSDAIWPLSSLYTKNGRPLQVSRSNVYSRSGKHVGHISGDKVYGPHARYAGRS